MTTFEFENFNISYVFNEAGMPFFVIHAYNNAEGESANFVNLASEYHKTLKEALSRVERGMSVPNTWKKKLWNARHMVDVLHSEKLITVEWHEQFYRMNRFLRTY